jgi:cytochrome c oxidase subunit I+III
MSARATPNPLPRPPEELARLEAVWEPPRGWRRLSAVNNTHIGLYYVATALLFLVLGGVLALLMRLQLATPRNGLVDYDLYNQLFTMHGSVMMFLFAVPVVEAIGVLLLPAMLGARDLPFPRLSAYAFWAYAIGGLCFYATIFLDLAPDGGWFMYPPLTSYEHSPGLRADVWLLGIGFIEISAIAGAIEIIVGILRTRPPGMTLDRMPVYAWAMLVVGSMIVFAFPPVILATALLELERAFQWPFFIAGRGGDPVLWQHLFWFFGHPDVYIIFLPAAGLVSMIVPTMARTPLVGYRWLVAALVATGAISFALWVHHMFAIGMPHHAASFFSAASMAVAVPAGIQVFAWIATWLRGRVRRDAPAWFLLAFFGVFVLGGLTGVMLAVVPFDWQAHDTYFVVAHLHYVLIGGLVFPVFAAIYYWAPVIGGRRLSEKMGKSACALMFAGVNLTFFPLHVAGLLGMPRRVWTYDPGLGWDAWNLAATAGAFVLAAGFAVALLDVLLHLRPAGKVDANPWDAATLEWLPTDNYGARSIPHVTSREPLWDAPGLRAEVDAGAHYLPGTLTGERETIVTSPLRAEPQYLLRLPRESWLPLLAGLGTAAFFLSLTIKLFSVAALGALLALVTTLRWLWGTEPAPTDATYDVGGGVRLADHMTGRRSHAWWAVVVLLVVDAIVFLSLVFSWLYLGAGAPDGWPPPGAAPPDAAASLVCALAWIVAPAVAWYAHALVSRDGARVGIVVALAASAVALVVGEAFALDALRGPGVSPQAHAYGAVAYALVAWQGLHVVLVAVMGAFTVARIAAGRAGPRRRAAFDHTRLFVNYTAVQGLASLALLHAPRIMG